ncbi:MAG TPA: type III-A CRISPR-associated protein Csm2 [Saprospiraceae bacterium]|nr:type III-A CRISPR-associated protein Csm2 [Saprospiraceae bacterium]HMP15202.1 type III-A CRISPR-associated protein Csm2 [Saprospiraceae bacterium]
MQELKIQYQSNSFPRKAIQDGITLDEVAWAHGFGEYLAGGKGKEQLSTTKLRKFFGELRRLEAEIEPKDFKTDQLVMLIPKLAYDVGRTKKDNRGNKVRVEDFYRELTSGISEVKEYTHFKNFIKLVEAIVAYHKVYESSNNNKNSDNH